MNNKNEIVTMAGIRENAMSFLLRFTVTASAPPGQKSFCTSIIKRSVFETFIDNITPYRIFQLFGSFANMRRGKVGAIAPVAVIRLKATKTGNFARLCLEGYSQTKSRNILRKRRNYKGQAGCSFFVYFSASRK